MQNPQTVKQKRVVLRPMPGNTDDAARRHTSGQTTLSLLVASLSPLSPRFSGFPVRFRCLIACLSVSDVSIRLCLSVSLSVCLSLFLCPLVSLSDSLYSAICLSLFLRFSVRMPVCLCLSVRLLVCLCFPSFCLCSFVFLSVCLYLCFSVCASLSPSICLSVCWSESASLPGCLSRSASLSPLSIQMKGRMKGAKVGRNKRKK